MNFLKKIATLRARTVTAVAAVSLVGVLALMSVMFTRTQGQAATPYEVLVTPEGTTIEMYTLQMKAQTVYDLLKRNGLDAETGKTLSIVRVWDEGATSSGLGVGLAGGKWVPVASMRLTAPSLAISSNLDIGHEFGHVFAHHYLWTLWNGSWDSYLRARGLYGDSRLNSSYVWRDTEIFAEDYRQLLASYEAWSELPDQLNKSIPLASQVPGLQAFLCTTFQGKASNGWFRCSGGTAPAPTPTPTPAPSPTPTPTPSPTPTPTPSPTPAPTPAPAPVDGSVTVTISGGWRTFTAPISGTTSVPVYLKKSKDPTTTVAAGRNYWAKGPASIVITP